MSACSACFHRAVQSLLADLPTQTLRTQRRTRALPTLHHHPLSARLLSRSHATVHSLSKGHHLRGLREASHAKRPIAPNNQRSPGAKKVLRRDALARENNRRHLSANDEAPSHGTSLQLQYLQDPVKLASAVLERLRTTGDEVGALELVRASERPVYESGVQTGGEVQNVVSWNHLMDWHMHKGDTRHALKIYNEMKKRGHRPDAHTYTIMLRGFADNVKKPNAVKDAVSVYNSIFAPNSAIKPNTIHTNAVINVCARGGEMDSLWAIAGRLPERGAGAADKWTYTSILNALKADAEQRAAALAHESGGDEAGARIIDEAVRDGEKLWEDVAKRWRAGDLLIDEPLTCAMGRLLLLSKRPTQWGNVFALVEQTMRVARYKDTGLLPAPPAMETELDQAGTEVKRVTKGIGETAAPVDSAEQINFTPVVAAVGRGRDQRNPPPSSSVYAKPGNNALSMLLQACILTRSLPAGKYYWDVLTNPEGAFKIQFDVENLSQYLRLLRISRSSRAVRDLLRQPYSEAVTTQFFKRGIFVIAMSTCMRDKNNPNVFEYATGILDQMQDKLDTPDAKVMEMYVQLAVLTTPGLGYTPGPFVPHARENNAMHAVTRLGQSAVNIKSLIKLRDEQDEVETLSSRRKKAAEKKNFDTFKVFQSKATLSSFLGALISVYDRLLTKKEIPESLRKDYLLQKKKLSAFVSKMVAPVPRRATNGTADPAAKDDDSEDEQEGLIMERARGVKGAKKFHNYSDEFRREEEKLWDQESRQGRAPSKQAIRNAVNRVKETFVKAPSHQKGWGSAFEDLANRRGRSVQQDFVDVGA